MGALKDESSRAWGRCFRGRVFCRHEDALLGARGRSLFRSRDEGVTWDWLLDLPVSGTNAVKSATSLLRRLFRHDVHHLVPTDARTVTVFAFGHVYVCDLLDGVAMSDAATIHGSRPLAVCRLPTGRLYYGEYRSNPDRQPIRIFASDDDGRVWAEAYSLSGVRHVHGVYYDKYRKAVWVTTGDTDSESAVWVSYDGLRSLDKVLEGSQERRAIRLLFTSDHVYFGSDAPDARNHIYRLAPRDGRLERLVSVDGPVFHGCTTGSGLFFSTACEPSRINRLREAQVWHSVDGETWRMVQRYRKDGMPMKLFQYGQVFLAEGCEGRPGVWLTPFATSEQGSSYYQDFPCCEEVR